jgi:serine protease Do
LDGEKRKRDRVDPVGRWRTKIVRGVQDSCLYAIGLLVTGLFFFLPAHAWSDPGTGTLDLRTAISHVAKVNIPAVVHIVAARSEAVLLPRAPFDHEPLLQYSFALPRKPAGRGDTQGTGIIIDRKGNILTSHHVVGGAEEILVFLDSGKKIPAILVGSDPKTDLAVIRVSSEDALPYVTFGDSDRLDIGEWVIAIARPRDYDPVVSQGIIRTRHRRGVTDPGTFKDLLQTDAAANNGYCGGPLLNLRGEVIGVNSAMVSEAPDFKGIGFAVPSNAAIHVAKKLIAQGKVERGWLGVRIQESKVEHGKTGVLVSDVIPGGPADRAGVKKGDVVLSYHGSPVEDVASLRNVISATAVGEEVPLILVREGKEESVTVQIGSAEDLSRILVPPIKDQLGAEVRPVSADEARKFNIQPPQGVMITWVDPQGPFGRVGFEPGDIILEANGHSFKSLEGFLLFVKSLEPEQRITIFALDHRSGHKGYVQIKMR